MSVAYLIMINRDYLKDTMRGGNILSSKMSGQAETSNPGLGGIMLCNGVMDQLIY
jgi:hypothetical protein